MNTGKTISFIDNRIYFALFAILSTALSLILLLLTLTQKPPEPSQAVSYFESHKGIYILFASISIIWATVSVPVVVAIGLLTRKLGQKGLTLTSIILTSFGLLLSGIVAFLYIGACLSMIAAKNIKGANIDYEISFWSNLYFYMTDPALMIWGLGQLFLGILLYRTGIFPKWINIITIVGGVSGLFTLVVFQTPFLALIQQLTFILLTSFTGFFLIKSKNLL